jgi:hypothetical protein
LKYYAALVDLSDGAAHAPAFEAPSFELAPLAVPIYGDALFHGDEFQVISKVEGVGQDGIVGDLVGVAERSWSGGPFKADPAAIDGGIQLAVLWAQQRLGGKGLPTGLGAYRSFTSSPASGPLRCTVAARPEGSHSAVSDITFVDGRGCVVLRLEGVETHQRP